ncbi:hypothetical protein D1Z90_14970 [Motilimonas pumila]|uniref:Uncharacterized protein n=1 Tax=Motilimonas pumila TaxID=2303987 RepID=A0A418YC36_9GAMM|nr:hypothetical protein D1Z90_14970 [Motilimonas pumila]
MNVKRLISLTWWVILLAAGVGMGFIYGERDQVGSIEVVDKLNQQIKELSVKLENANFTLAVKETEIETEKATVERLSKDLKTTQMNVFELRKELTFYQKVLSPELMVGGVAIDSFEFDKLATGDFNYRLVLVQLAKNRRAINGDATFTIMGSKGNDKIELPLEQTSIRQKDSLAIDFTYFQIFEGKVRLPAGFNPIEVELALDLKPDSAYKGEQWSAKYIWSDIMPE